MSDEVTMAMWQQYAIDIGEHVYGSVNTKDTIGTEHETGYLLMFFWATRHEGKSTLVSSMTDKKQVRQLLEAALNRLDDTGTIIEPPKMQ